MGKTACRQTTFRTYYSRLLFYAFLTKEPVNSLEEMLVVLEQGENPRIARNLGLSREILELFVRHMNAFVLSRLDYKIQNISRLANDPSLSPIERVLTAIRKFKRLSSSEVATPERVTEEMTGLLPDKCFAGLLEVTNGASVDYEKIARILSQGKPLNAITLKDTAAGGRR